MKPPDQASDPRFQAGFTEMERSILRQRVNEGLAAARARGRKGRRTGIITPDKLRYAAHPMAESTRSIPEACRELGGMRPSTLYHFVHADGSLKASGRDLLAKGGKEESVA